MSSAFQKTLLFLILSAVGLGMTLATAQPRAADFAPVVPGRSFRFPQDHGAHPEFKTEWWYFTGHLRSKEGRRFGFQWTVFRSALRPSASPRPTGGSAWRSDQALLGHLALSDLDTKTFYFEENASRAALGIAGAKADDFKVWLSGFSAENQEDNWVISAEGQDLGFLLRLPTPKPDGAVLHGEGGYSPKSEEAGKASYYYSLPRLPLSGELRLKGERLQVEGEAWMDHEFGSGQLSENQSGWDWMGLPLGEGSALMVYRLRDRQDAKRDYVSGTYVDGAGQIHRLTRNDIQLEPSNYWLSPRSKGKYPITWKVRIPKYRVELSLDAEFPAQELDTRKSTQVVYWEGSVRISGQADGRKIESHGYLEMTGYARAFDKKL